LRKSFHTPREKMKPEFEKFLSTIKKHEKNRFATRSFAYLDIISWVESKVYGKTMSEIVKQRYLTSRHRA